MEKNEYVDFNTIKELVSVTDENLFMVYLREVYKDLIDRVESSKKQGIGKITFYDYMKLPIFIAEKVFAAFDKDEDSFLSLKEFIEGMMQLYFGSFRETVKIIFNIFDFDRDGKINRSDIKTTMSYLPLKDVTHKDQMEALKEIDEILDYSFKNSQVLKLDKFLDLVQNKKSDIYLQLLCFLYQNKPFSEDNVNAYRNYKKGSSPKKNYSPGTNNKENILLSSPSRKSKLKPGENLLERMNLEDDEDNGKFSLNIKPLENPVGKNTDIMLSEEDLQEGVIRLPNTKTDGKSILDSPTKFFKKAPNRNDEFALESNLISLDGDLSQLSKKSDSPNQQQKFARSPMKRATLKKEETFNFSDWIYKITDSSNIKKYYLSIVGKDIYYYKNDQRDDLQGMHNLTGCFIKEKGEKKVDGKKLYGFSIIFSNKTRNYYTASQEDLNKWIQAFKYAIGYQSFSDFYDMKSTLGEGKFGLVKLGIHKKTGEKVAIKIIKKETMDNKDLELVRSEIDIMKLCRHKNVVRLLDHFENSEFIYIVMEYLEGGDLGHFFKKNKFNFNENQGALVIRQILEGLEYLHKYGVVHRDLKPDNIMLSKSNSLSEIKIMDFGLSKIMSPLEKAADGFGTLSFVAPEVLIRKPYNKEVDIWSVGITLYYMLTGLLPFDDDSDNEEIIAKKIVFSQLSFNDKKWSKFSTGVKDFITLCLIKDPEKREPTDKLLAHKWLNTH